MLFKADLSALLVIVAHDIISDVFSAHLVPTRTPGSATESSHHGNTPKQKTPSSRTPRTPKVFF